MSLRVARIASIAVASIPNATSLPTRSGDLAISPAMRSHATRSSHAPFISPSPSFSVLRKHTAIAAALAAVAAGQLDLLRLELVHDVLLLVSTAPSGLTRVRYLAALPSLRRTYSPS